ncbi:MAG: ABC transporter permease [Candidatus Schekmanbacteria bacterium]|nr:ABC transporter permease [Candidatus Schekmanbacteria bacterium]
MMAFALRRLVYLVPTLAGVSVLVFSTMHLSGGDPARIMLGERARPETVAALRVELGLDRPIAEQYVRYAVNLLRGDLGRSIKSHTPVTEEIAARFPATVELALAAMLLAAPAGIAAGAVAARRRGGWVDVATMTGSLCGISLPVFWLGLILILLFAVLLPETLMGLRERFGAGVPVFGFPVSGRLDLNHAPPWRTGLAILDSLLAGDARALLSTLRHLVLPAVTLGTIPLAVIARMTRSELLSELQQDYVRTARAKGASERSVTYRHALRNALIPVLTTIGLQFGYLLGGAVLTETIFAWPGIGRWLVGAVMARDFPAVQGGTLLVAVLFVLANLLVDLLYAAVDPRLRLASE